MGKKRHKTTFSDLIVARSGFSKDKLYTFVTLKNGAGDPLCTHIRRATKNTTTTPHQIAFGERHRAITDLWRRFPQGFMSDLARYTHAYNLQHRRDDHPLSAFNVIIKVLSKQATVFVSLLSLSQSLGNTLDEWIENGILRRVNVSQPFNASLLV